MEPSGRKRHPKGVKWSTPDLAAGQKGFAGSFTEGSVRSTIAGLRDVGRDSKPIGRRRSWADPACYEMRRASCVRDFTPSLRNTLRRWYSTVLALMNS
jgi:hypothetical protein